MEFETKQLTCEPVTRPVESDGANDATLFTKNVLDLLWGTYPLQGVCYSCYIVAVMMMMMAQIKTQWIIDRQIDRC